MAISRVDQLRVEEFPEFHFADGVMVKMLTIPRAGMLLRGHEHVYDHATMLARGSMRVWANGELVGVFHAPCGLFITSGTVHEFLALEDNTIFYCIHNTHGFPPDELEKYLTKHEVTS